MSPTPDSGFDVTLREPQRTEQRGHSRYPITLELEYKLLNDRFERRGVGRALNISSGGILFESDHSLPASGPIELAMDWPFLLDNVVTLKLVMRGRIVRRDAKAIAVKAEHHEFRTAGANSPKTAADHA